MKNTAINSLSYTGTVTLSQYAGTKKLVVAKIHNTGLNRLFSFLSDCLIGDFEAAKVNRPDKIMLLKKDSDGDYVKASDFIYFLSSPEKVYSTSASIVKYSFIIPRDMLLKDFHGIGLYAYIDKEYTNPAAYCAIDKDKIKLSTSSVLVVDWELNIANRTIS